MNTQTTPLTVVHLADYEPPPFLIRSVDLTFDLDPSRTTVTARTSFTQNLQSRAPLSSLKLDGENLDLNYVRLDGKELSVEQYKTDETSLTIHNVSKEFELEVSVNISPIDNKSLEGLYLSSGRFCTQCEAEGFRHIMYFLDRPDILARYRVVIIANREKYPILLSNGNCISREDLDEDKHVCVWEDPFPKPCYLFALVAGDLVCLTDFFRTKSAKQVALHLYVEHGKREKAQFAMDSLKRAMTWDEDVYELEYDLDEFNIVAVSDFNMGAMENKSLNIFNDKYILADPNTATDADYEWIEAIVAHEYFHNWTGNRITCRDWFQLSLKEGLTVFRDQQFSSDMRSAAVKRIDDVRLLRTAQFPEDAGPLAHPVRPESYSEINNFYTHTVYEKGAEVVRMLHTILGDSTFQDGMKLYVERHDGHAVTCEDFVAAMSDASAAPLDQFMNWYRLAGTPVLRVDGQYNATTKIYTLRLGQSKGRTPITEMDKLYSIPQNIGFLDAVKGPLEVALEGGDELKTAAHSILIDRNDVEYRFAGFPDNVAPIASFNRNFSAPIIVDIERSVSDLQVLIRHDPDAFVRWDALQELMLRHLVGQLSGTEEDESLNACLDVLLALNSDASHDPALAALMLIVPSEAVIAQRMDTLDPIAIYNARHEFMCTIAERLQNDFRELYHTFRVHEPYEYNANHSGRRALSNTALAFLALLPDGNGLDLTLRHYEQAENMTDRWAALAALNDIACPQRSEALFNFHDRHHDDPLTLDKWFGLEAMSNSDKQLGRVENLLTHKKYDASNPNRIRAVVGAFANSNTTGFHDITGAGYTFVADQIIMIDAFNPQVAARLAGSFQKWRRYGEERQALIKQELERLKRHSSISKDVAEIVTKSLE